MRNLWLTPGSLTHLSAIMLRSCDSDSLLWIVRLDLVSGRDQGVLCAASLLQ